MENFRFQFGNKKRTEGLTTPNFISVNNEPRKQLLCPFNTNCVK